MIVVVVMDTVWPLEKGDGAEPRPYQNIKSFSSQSMSKSILNFLMLRYVQLTDDLQFFCQLDVFSEPRLSTWNVCQYRDIRCLCERMKRVKIATVESRYKTSLVIRPGFQKSVSHVLHAMLKKSRSKTMIFIAQWMKIAAKVTRYKNSVVFKNFDL